MKLKAHNLIQKVGRRGALLLFLGVLDVIYAYSLAHPTAESIHSQTYMYLASIGGLNLWAILWAITGLLALFYAFRRNDAPAYTACTAIKILWAVIFFLGWLFAGVERGYLSTAIWGSFAGIIWMISSWPEVPSHWTGYAR